MEGAGMLLFVDISILLVVFQISTRGNVKYYKKKYKQHIL